MTLRKWFREGNENVPIEYFTDSGDKEKDLTKKVDGGEVEIKIPIN